MDAQVREVAAEAIARARRGDGPTLIEAETYRFRGHSLADPDELRQKEEKDHYAVRAAATCTYLKHAPRVDSRLSACIIDHELRQKDMDNHGECAAACT